MERFFNSIEYIEQHLFDKMALQDIAASSYYSAYHFSRIFKALVGDTPKEYIRKRRLTVAAQKLLDKQESIIDLAIACQFDSQEAFTRAFKQVFNTTPAQYRKRQQRSSILYKETFSPETLAYLQDELSMEPEILTQPAMKLVGIAQHYNNADLSLPKLWSAFRPYNNNIPNRVEKNCFGIYEGYQETENDVSFTYVCTAQVTNFDQVPEGMQTRELPEQMYAKFTHKGPINKLEQTLKYIWGSWLPKSKYSYEEKPDFELYRPDFNKDPNNTEIHLHIPIASK